MQQFTVPQFIEVEPKIIGPISVRQFIILLLGAFFLFLEYKLADFTLFVVEGLITIMVVSMFAFVKINGKPFYLFVISFLLTLRRAKLRVWKKDRYWSDGLHESKPQEEISKQASMVASSLQVKRRQARHLSELSLLVDTGGEYQSVELASSYGTTQTKQ